MQILRFFSIISLVVAAIKLGLSGLLNQWWVVFFIVCGILLLAGGRRLLIVVSAIASLVLFVKLAGGGSTFILGAVLQLAIVCFGLYFMVRGFFPRSGGRRRY